MAFFLPSSALLAAISSQCSYHHEVCLDGCEPVDEESYRHEECAGECSSESGIKGLQLAFSGERERTTLVGVPGLRLVSFSILLRLPAVDNVEEPRSDEHSSQSADSF